MRRVLAAALAALMLFGLAACAPVPVSEAHLITPPPPLASKREGLAVVPQLEAIVQKALAKKPEQRFANAGEMLAALEALPAPAAWISGLTHVPPQPIAPPPQATQAAQAPLGQAPLGQAALGQAPAASSGLSPLVLAAIFLLVNLVVDMSYGLFDPRVRYG